MPRQTNKMNPTAEEFIKHLQDRKHIIYAGTLFANDLKNSTLLSSDSRIEFIYSIKDSKTFVIKRKLMHSVNAINFKLDFVELVYSPSI